MVARRNEDEVAKLQPRNLTIILFVIVLVAFLLRIWGIWFGLPYFFHPDEHYLVEKALALNIHNLNPRWFQWPGNLQMYILFVVFFFVHKIVLITEFNPGFIIDLPVFYLIGRIISALMGTATVGFVYLIGKKLYDEWTGALASLFLAFTFLHIQDSHFATADIPSLFFLSGAFLFACLILKRQNTIDYIGAGIFVGFATAIKYNAALGAIFILTAHLLAKSREEGGVKKFLDTRILLAFIFIGAGFIISTPFSILDFRTFWNDLIFEIGRASGAIRHLGWEREGAWLYYLTSTLRDGMGLPLEVLALGGILYGMIFRRKKEDLLLGIFPIIYFLWVARLGVAIDRYLIPILPFFVIFAAALLIRLANYSSSKEGTQKLIALITAGLVILPSGYLAVRSDVLLAGKDTRIVAKEWVESQIPSGTSIAVEGYGPPIDGRRYKIYYIWKKEESWLGYKESAVRTFTQVKDDLRRTQAVYMIISSGDYAKYYTPSAMRRPNKLITQRHNFYKWLDSNGRLIKEWDPNPASKKFPPSILKYDEIVYFEMPAGLLTLTRAGPTIRIYELPSKK